MKMKPMGDQVLLKKKEGQEKTKSGIILTADTSNYMYAEVQAVGLGLFTQTGDRIPMTVKKAIVSHESRHHLAETVMVIPLTTELGPHRVCQLILMEIYHLRYLSQMRCQSDQIAEW